MNKTDKTVIDNVTKHIEALREQADMQITAPKKLVDYPSVKDYAFHNAGSGINSGLNLKDEYFFQSSSGFNRYFDWDKFTKEDFDTVMKRFDAAKDKWIKDALEIQKQNEDIISHNKVQYNQIKKMMSVLGIGETHTAWSYKTSRSSKMTKTTTISGWVTDLKKVLQLEDNYKTEVANIDKKRKSVEAYGLRKLKEIETLREEKEKKDSEARKLQELAFLRVKYTPSNAVAASEDVLYEILSKDKYLRLAHFLQANRNDWTSGYSLADIGLEGFVVETDFDKAVEASLREIIYSEDGWEDGRVFRECEYNYGVLFSEVKDEQLLEDYKTVMKFID